MAIDGYQILPPWAVMAVARFLPWFELLLGVLLMTGLWQRISTASASAILLGFFVLLVRSYLQGLQIDCGCFGFGEAISSRTLVRDGSLLACSVVLTIAAFRTPCPALSGFPSRFRFTK
jgi:hypothetical protein